MDVKQRIERLEKQNRVLWFFSAIAALTFICFIAMGATVVTQVTSYKVIRVQKVELVDTNGNIRGEMGVNQLGPYMHFDDRKHGNLASMGIANGVPHVTLERAGRTRSITP